MKNRKFKIDEGLKGLLPHLTDDEFKNLEEDIKAHGCIDDLKIWKEENVLIDGHYRLTVCEKHGFAYNITYMSFPDRSTVEDWIDQHHLARRHLTNDQYKCIIGRRYNRLKRQGKRTDLTSGQNDRKSDTAKGIADEYGMSDSTVKRCGKLALEVDSNPRMKHALDKKIPLREARKEVRDAEKAKKRREIIEEGRKISAPVDLRHGNFTDVFNDLPDGSVDCIVTDPPYGKDDISVWDELGKFAKRVLKPNGFCIMHCGVMYKPNVQQLLDKSMDYYWEIAIKFGGGSMYVKGRNIVNGYRPVLVYQNGFRRTDHRFRDYIEGSGADKTAHDWQQGLAEVCKLIECFSDPGDLILDPFAGSGTTLIAGLKTGRKVKGAEISDSTFSIAKKQIADWQETDAASPAVLPEPEREWEVTADDAKLVRENTRMKGSKLFYKDNPVNEFQNEKS